MTAAAKTSTTLAPDLFLKVVIGDREGVLCVAYGRSPRRNERGKYEHVEWQELTYAWPTQRDELASDIRREKALGEPVDIYVCPAIRQSNAKRRRKGDAIPPAVLWADLDDEPADAELYARLVDGGSLVVTSGSDGHRHLYLPLAHPIDLGRFNALNEALADRLGGDAKWTDNSLLRMPGTFNYKATVPPVGQSAGPAALVEIVSHTPGAHDLDELAQLLGVDLSATTSTAGPGPTTDGATITPEPLPNPLPELVARRMREDSPDLDRSAAHHALIGACKDAGLTKGQALTAAMSYAPSVGKYGHRLANEVARSWGRTEDKPTDSRFLGGAQTADTPGNGSHSTADGPNRSSEGKDSGTATGTRTVRLKRASEFVMRATDWVWDQRIPVGGLTLIAGREGDGKSTLSYTTLAQVTRGTLAGDLYGTPRNVAVAATEDSWELTIVPRLVAANADLDRVFHIEVVNSFGAETVLQLPHDLDGTERALREADVPVLLLDPLMSRLEGRLDTHKDSEVRQALEPLVALADRARCAVVGLIHLNKGGGTDPLNAIMASKAFVAVARSVLFVMRDPDDEQRRQRSVGLVKANLTADDEVPTLGFTIESRKVGEDPTSGKPITAGALVWGAESSRPIRDMISAAVEDPDARSTRDEAKTWLLDFLTERGGSSMRREVVRAGNAAAFSESTLKRAANELKIVKSSQGYPRETVWALPGHMAAPVGSGPWPHSQVSSEDPQVSSS